MWILGLKELRNDNDDGNENIKKAIKNMVQIRKTTNLYVPHAFFTFLCRRYTTTVCRLSSDPNGLNTYGHLMKFTQRSIVCRFVFVL